MVTPETVKTKRINKQSMRNKHDQLSEKLGPKSNANVFTIPLIAASEM
jgi:hypothetical protein